jgi:hypothetical protein
MANEIPAGRHLIRIPEARYLAAVSESILKRLGAVCNFINTRHIEREKFALNGFYEPRAGYLAVDGIFIFEFDSEIVNAHIYNLIKGTGGTTELDIKWKPQVGGAWASIFSTTPKIASTVSDYSSCGVGDSITGFTAPVLSKTQFAAKDMLRLDLVTCMTGSPVGCGINLHHRPR